MNEIKPYPETKPLSKYPEERAKILDLCERVNESNYECDALKAAYELADLVKSILEDETFGEKCENRDVAAYDRLLTPRHVDEWSEDFGPVLWWTHPATEVPYVGSPLDCGQTVEMRHYIGGEGEVKTVSTSVGGWPGYHNWWTPLPTGDEVDLIQKRIEVAEKARAVKASQSPQ